MYKNNIKTDDKMEKLFPKSKTISRLLEILKKRELEAAENEAQKTLQKKEC